MSTFLVSGALRLRASFFIVLALATVGAPAAADFHTGLIRDIGRAIIADQLRQNSQQQQRQTQRAQPQRQQAAPQRQVNPAAANEPRMSRETKRRVQTALNTLTFNVGSADGIIGRGTRSGIRRWQSANGFGATGYLTNGQLQQLLSVRVAQAQPQAPVDPRQAPLNAQQTFELQRNLQSLGFYNGPLDGRPGATTGNAIQSFLASRGHNANAVAPLFALQLAQSAVQGTAAPAVIPSAGAGTAFPTQQATGGFPAAQGAGSAFPTQAPTAFPGQAPTAFPGQAAAAAPVVPLNQGDVFALQINLKQLGFYNGNVDGISGPGTQRAIDGFLTSQGMSPATTPPQFALQLANAVVQGTPRPTLEPNAGFGGALATTAPVASAPKPLAQRTIVDLRQSNMSSPALLLMALSANPKLLDDPQVVQTILNNNLFAEDIPIDRSRRNDPSQVAIFKTGLRTLASRAPTIPELTFKIQGNFARPGSPPAYDPQRQIWPLQQPIEASLRKYGAYYLNGLNREQVFVEIPDLPDLLGNIPINPSEQLAIVQSNQNRAYEVDTFIHVKVEGMVYDSVRDQLQLKLAFDSADIRSRRDTALAKQISGGQAFVPGSDTSKPKFLQLAEIFREKAPDDPSGVASVIDGYINLSTNQRYQQNVMSGLYTAISLKLQPELLESDAFAIEVAPLLLNEAETQRWIRGFEGQQVRAMNAFDRRELAQRMRSEFTPTLNDRAFAGQMKFVTFRNVRIGQYDFARGGFPLQVDDRRQIQNGRLGLAINGYQSQVQMLLPTGFVFPDLLVMDETQARTFASRMDMGSRELTGVMGLYIDVPGFSRLETREFARQQGREYILAGGAVSSTVDAVKLFRDAQLSEQIAEFEVLEDQEALRAGKVLDLPIATGTQMLASMRAIPSGDEMLAAYIAQSQDVIQGPASQKDAKIEEVTQRMNAIPAAASHWMSGGVQLGQYDPRSQSFQATIQLAPTNDPDMPRSNVQLRFEHLRQVTITLTEEDLLEWVPDGDPYRVLEPFGGAISIKAHVVPQSVVDDGNGRVWTTQLGMIEYYIVLGSQERTGGMKVLQHRVLLPGMAVDLDTALAAASAVAGADTEAAEDAAAGETAAEVAQAPAGPARDILGVRLGMTLDEAAEALGTRYDAGVILDARASGQPDAYFQTGRAFVKSDGSERLTLYYEDGPDPATVLAVERVLIIRDFKVPAEAVQKSAATKYGEPGTLDLSDGLLMDWSVPDQTQCGVGFDQAKIANWAVGDAPATGPMDNFVDMSNVGDTSVGFVPNVGADVSYANCAGETLFVRQDNRQILTFLADLAQYEASYYVARGLNADGSDPAAAEPEVAIEF